ncbi:MAG: hypothetical protein GY765_10330, partial [bacterium]|nr:hypothetical protein [bacterium]
KGKIIITDMLIIHLNKFVAKRNLLKILENQHLAGQETISLKVVKLSETENKSDTAPGFMSASITKLTKGVFNENQWEAKWIITVGNKTEGNQIEENTVSIEKWGDGYLYIKESSVFRGGHLSWELYLVGILLLLINFFLLDVNITSLHGFYRDRLSKAFLVFENKEGEKKEGETKEGEQKEGTVVHNDDLKLSDLNGADTIAPYHLINTTLNVPSSDKTDLRGRNADFFTFSKNYSGSDITGYCKTDTMEELNPHINLGTAMAISAAAASPAMGTMTKSGYTFMLTLLNARLNYWVPNPFKINSPRLTPHDKFMFQFAGPKYLFKEAFGHLHEKSQKINLSDGGHIENLAIYQLLKRRCRFIIAVDGEADPNMTFSGLSTLLRYAKIDMGIDIDIDLGKLRKDSNGHSKKHWTLGKIKYAEKKENQEEEVGLLLYIKLSVLGNETEYIKDYRRHNPKFPHQSTADQFF